MRAWSGGLWHDTADFSSAVAVYRSAMQVPQAAYGASEYSRWMVRSLLRPDGYAFQKTMRRRLRCPVLQLHGQLDRNVLPHTAQGSGAYVEADYRWQLLDGCGHFPAEEHPDIVSAALLAWLQSIERT